MTARSKRPSDNGSTAIYEPARHDDRRAAVAVIDALSEPSELRTIAELPATVDAPVKKMLEARTIVDPPPELPLDLAPGESSTFKGPPPGESSTFDEQDDAPPLGDPPSMPPTAVQVGLRRRSSPTTPAPSGPPPPSPPRPRTPAAGTAMPANLPAVAPYPTHVDAPPAALDSSPESAPIRVISMKDSEPVRRPREEPAPLQVQLRAIADVVRRDQPEVVDRNLAWEQARARQARRNVRWVVLGIVLAAAIALAIWLIAGR